MKKGFKDDNPAMAFISQRDAGSVFSPPVGNSSDDVSLNSESEGTSSRSENLRQASGLPSPGGEAASSCTLDFAPLGDSSGDIGLSSEPEGTSSRSENLRQASGLPPPGGEAASSCTLDSAPLGDSSGDIGLSSEPEGTGSRSENLRQASGLPPPGGEKIAGPAGPGPAGPSGGEENKYRMDPRYIETKSKRFGILIQPSVLGLLKELAKGKGISVNEAINEAVKRYIQSEEGDQW